MCANLQCIPACNPPCNPGEYCTAAGTCLLEASPPSATAKAAFEGLHLALGVSVGGGFSIVSANSKPATGDGTFLAAIRVSALFGRFELQAELSPITFVPATSGPGMLSATGTAGGYLHVGGPVYWPLRAGVGFVTVNTPGDKTYFEARGDLIGVAFRTGDFLFELSAPTYRFLGDFDKHNAWVFSFNLGASWIL